jgi:hypothetical protein
MITNLRKYKLLIHIFILPEMIHDVAGTINVEQVGYNTILLHGYSKSYLKGREL